eukprot:9433406-Lingulodinium_polyedra.AAC.1
MPPINECCADVQDLPGLVKGEGLRVADVHDRDVRVEVEQREAAALAVDLDPVLAFAGVDHLDLLDGQRLAHVPEGAPVDAGDGAQD